MTPAERKFAIDIVVASSGGKRQGAAGSHNPAEGPI